MLFPDIGAGWEQEALKQRGTSGEPGSSLLLLPSGLAEGRVPHQWLTRVGPLVRMRLLAGIPLQPRLQPFLEIRHTGEHPTAEEPPRQDAEEQLHLVQPRPVDRCEVKYIFVALVGQEGPPLRPCPQFSLVDLQFA